MVAHLNRVILRLLGLRLWLRSRHVVRADVGEWRELLACQMDQETPGPILIGDMFLFFVDRPFRQRGPAIIRVGFAEACSPPDLRRTPPSQMDTARTCQLSQPWYAPAAMELAPTSGSSCEHAVAIAVLFTL